MNEEKNKQLHTLGEEFSLTREERTRMRRVVYSYMEMRPVRPVRGVASNGADTHWFLAVGVRPVAALLVAAVFISSAGVSYAAQSALPGDVLYAIKTRVNEPIEGALAVSKSAKTAWAMKVAGERIKEAATLAAEGRLSTTTQQQLQENFDAHAEAAIATIEEQASTSPDTSAETAVRFEAQLSEYGRVLTQVGGTQEATSSALTSAIKDTEDRVAAIRVRAMARAEHSAATATSTSAGAASRLREAAKKQLRASLKLSLQSSDALDASSSAQVALQLESASTTIFRGEESLGRNDDVRANAAFQNALSATEKLGVFLQTSSAIHERTGRTIGQEGDTASSSHQQSRRGHKGSD